jgi:hypothetical protein
VTEMAEADRIVLLAQAQRLRADLKAAYERHGATPLPGAHDADHVFGEAWSQAGDVVEELENRT